jgi:hypothetical protein
MTALNDGSLDLGAAVDDELTASMVQTLTGGGLADSLHNHTADGGGTVSGGKISFKGITTTTQIGDAGRAQMDADCHAEFENSRMCRMHDLMEMYPAPVPGVEGRVLNIFATGAVTGSNSANSQTADGGYAYADEGRQNCNESLSNYKYNPFSSTNNYTTLIDADGNFSNNMCVNSYPTACCGP